MSSLTIISKDHINCIIPCLFAELLNPCEYCYAADIVLKGTSRNGNDLIMIIEPDKAIVVGDQDDIDLINKIQKQRCQNEIQAKQI